MAINNAILASIFRRISLTDSQKRSGVKTTHLIQPATYSDTMKTNQIPMIAATVLFALFATLSTSCTVVREAEGGHGGPPMSGPSRAQFDMEDRAAFAGRPYYPDQHASRPQGDPRMQRPQPIEQPRGEFKMVQTGRDHYNGRLRNGEVHWTLNGSPVSASEVPQQAKAGFDAGLRQRGYSGPIRHVEVSLNHAQSVSPAHTPSLPKETLPLENLPEPQPEGGSLLPYPADDGAAPPLPEWAPSAPPSQFVRA